MSQVEYPKQIDASGKIINPATEETLASIKAQTDKLTFQGSDLKVLEATAVENYFTRIMNSQFHDTEQFKSDVPATTFSNGYEYLGLAASTALDADTTWAIVRVEYNAAGDPIGKRIRLNVAWSARTSGW